MTFWLPQYHWLGGSGFSIDLVGAANHQTALRHAMGRVNDDDETPYETDGVTLAEPENVHDPLAVGVFIDGHRIGYLPRDRARGYHESVRRHQLGDQPIGVHIEISGGWLEADGSRSDLSARVYMDWPPQPDSSPAEIDAAYNEAHAAAAPEVAVPRAPQLDTAQLMLVEQRVASGSKSTALAYVLWFFLGILSIHRFYLGRPGTAVLQILSYFIVVGVIWWIIDAFLIPSMVEQHSEKLRTRLMERAVQPAGVPDMSRWSKRDRETWYAERGMRPPA